VAPLEAGGMKPRCAGCGRRIPRSEPDLILRRMDAEDPTRTALKLVFHERCKDAALERAASTPALWYMTHRYIEAVAK
jgi:hypothetical protein